MRAFKFKPARTRKALERTVNFVKESWSEMKKVVWPDFNKETWPFSKIVLVVVIVFAIYMGLLDTTLAWLMRAVGLYR